MELLARRRLDTLNLALKSQSRIQSQMTSYHLGMDELDGGQDSSPVDTTGQELDDLTGFQQRQTMYENLYNLFGRQENKIQAFISLLPTDNMVALFNTLFPALKNEVKDIPKGMLDPLIVFDLLTGLFKQKRGGNSARPRPVAGPPSKQIPQPPLIPPYVPQVPNLSLAKQKYDNNFVLNAQVLCKTNGCKGRMKNNMVAFTAHEKTKTHQDALMLLIRP